MLRERNRFFIPKINPVTAIEDEVEREVKALVRCTDSLIPKLPDKL